MDNPFFSEFTVDNGEAENGGGASDITVCAVTCKSEPSDAVRAYVEAGIAPATRRAYKADLDHFRAWGGDIPTTEIQLAAYLAEQATTLKVATLTRRLAAISIAHKAQRLPSPVSSPLVRATIGVCGVNTGQHSVRRPRFSVRTSLSFSARWVIGSRTSEIGLCC